MGGAGLGRRSRAGVLAGLAGVLLAGLAACSGDDEPESSPSGPQPTAESSATPYVPVPTTVALTDEGEQLGLARTATVAWQPRQDLVGVLRVSVNRIERTTFEQSFREWKVDEPTRTYTPYFVHAYVTNAGETELGGLPVPLYGLSAANALIEPSTFASRFKPCHPSTLPAKFAPGEGVGVCLVYLVPDGGELAGVAFRPSEEFRPITWTGTIATLTPAPTPTPRQPKASPTAAG